MEIEEEIVQIFAGLDTAKFNADAMVNKAADEAERQVVSLLRRHGVGISDEKLHEAFKRLRISALVGRSGT